MPKTYSKRCTNGLSLSSVLALRSSGFYVKVNTLYNRGYVIQERDELNMQQRGATNTSWKTFRNTSGTMIQESNFKNEQAFCSKVRTQHVNLVSLIVPQVQRLGGRKEQLFPYISLVPNSSRLHSLPPRLSC